MLEGQSVTYYLTVMKEFKTQLEKMGETIAASTHAATTLSNLPESWRPIPQTIRMITRDPDVIEECLEAHEADLTALEMSDQAATAFVAQPKPPRPSMMQPPFQNNTGHRPNEMLYNNNPCLPLKPLYHCNNCRKDGHSASQCFAPGGGLASRPIWRNNGIPHNSNMKAHISTPKPPFISNNSPPPPPEKQFPAIIAQPTDKKGNNMIMIASLSDAPGIKVEYDNPIDIPLVNRGPHTWLIDSAATSHLSGDISLFHTTERINPVTIQLAESPSLPTNVVPSGSSLILTLAFDSPMSLSPYLMSSTFPNFVPTYYPSDA